MLLGRKFACLMLAGAVLGGTVADASAATARHYYNKGHRYGYNRHYRHYGNPAVGAAVAGTALGIIGLAAGAAAADRYDDGYGYGNGYYGGGPGYYGGGPGFYGPYGGGGWAPY